MESGRRGIAGVELGGKTVDKNRVPGGDCRVLDGDRRVGCAGGGTGRRDSPTAPGTTAARSTGAAAAASGVGGVLDGEGERPRFGEESLEIKGDSGGVAIVLEGGMEGKRINNNKGNCCVVG